MKKIVLVIIGLCLSITSCNIGNTKENYISAAYTYKSVETLKDSKGRPHRIVVFNRFNNGVCAIDLDVNTYK